MICRMRTRCQRLKGVDRVRGCCPADEGATRAVDSQVWVEGLLWSELVVLLEEMVFDVGGEFSEVDWLSVHERRILVSMLDSTTEDVVEAAAASPDVVDENLVEFWYLGPEDVAADVAFFLGGVGHGGGRLWCREKVVDGLAIEKDDGSGRK